MYHPASSFRLVGRVSSAAYLGGGETRPAPSALSSLSSMLPVLGLMVPDSGMPVVVLDRSSSASKDDEWERSDSLDANESLENKRGTGGGRRGGSFPSAMAVAAAAE